MATSDVLKVLKIRPSKGSVASSVVLMLSIKGEQILLSFIQVACRCLESPASPVFFQGSVAGRFYSLERLLR